MGCISDDRLKNPRLWEYTQVDLFGPTLIKTGRFTRGGQSRKKVWTLVLEDTNSGAINMELVEDYSSKAVVEAFDSHCSMS